MGNTVDFVTPSPTEILQYLTVVELDWLEELLSAMTDHDARPHS
ncbi:hypothetical protein [Nonomuraea sp. NPDC050643]